MMRQPGQPPMNMSMGGQTPMRFNPQPPQMPPSGAKRPMQLPPPPGVAQMAGPRPQAMRNRKRRNLDRAIMNEVSLEFFGFFIYKVL